MIPSMMKALVVEAADRYVLKEVPVPEVGEDDILVKVEACGICAGDIKASHGAATFWGTENKPAYCEPPFIPGHEFYGTIVKIGANVDPKFKVGDRVISEQIVPCGECWYCKQQQYWLCDPHNVYGYKKHLNGGMAEYAILPKGSINYHVPKDFSLEQAVLIEPFACSLHGVRRANVTKEDTVVVAGAGTLGLGMTGALRMLNPKKLIVLDLMDERLEHAKRLGADVTFNPSKCNVAEEIRSLTNGVGCDVYIEVTGHPAAVKQGLDLVRKGGRFVEFSVMSGTSEIDWSIIGDNKELNIYGSSLSPHCYEDVIRYIGEGKMPITNVVSHKFKLDQWKEAFATAQTKGAVKVVFEM